MAWQEWQEWPTILFAKVVFQMFQMKITRFEALAI